MWRLSRRQVQAGVADGIRMSRNPRPPPVNRLSRHAGDSFHHRLRSQAYAGSESKRRDGVIALKSRVTPARWRLIAASSNDSCSRSRLTEEIMVGFEVLRAARHSWIECERAGCAPSSSQM